MCAYVVKGFVSLLGGTPPIPFLRPFDFAQGERNSPPLGMDSCSAGGVPSGGMGSCLRRKDGGEEVPARRGGALSGGMGSRLGARQKRTYSICDLPPQE